MDVTLNYKVRLNAKAALEKARPKVLKLIESTVRDVVDGYIKELEEHIGTIPGVADYTDTEVSWSRLDLDADELNRKFWYRTGGVAKSVVVNLRVSNEGVKVFAGIPKGSAHYNKALWNELGFVPQDGDELIRRPVFIPLSDEHMQELMRRLRELTKNMKLQVTVT